jgi:hypothetical protein
MDKPVAMMYQDDKLGTQFTTTCGSAVMNHPNWTPLYKHPIRELSDEEIKNLHEETSWLGITDPIKFAKAILKKATEK